MNHLLLERIAPPFWEWYARLSVITSFRLEGLGHSFGDRPRAASRPFEAMEVRRREALERWLRGCTAMFRRAPSDALAVVLSDKSDST